MRRREGWLLLFVLLSAALLYHKVLSFPFVNWDDPNHTYRNPALLHPEQLSWRERWFPRHLGYPMPLTILSYRLDRALFSQPLSASAGGREFHRTNFALGLLLAALVYILCRMFTPVRWAAIAAALLFVVHPILVEPVAWVSGRKDLLAAVFSLGALLCWLRWIACGRAWQVLLFLLLGLLGIASKPSAVYVVFLASLLYATLRPVARRSRLWPILALSALLAFAVASMVVSYQWNRAVGGVELARGAWPTLRRATWALGYHANLLLAPIGLRPKYIAEPLAFSCYDLLGVAVAAASVVLLARRQQSTATRVGIALFLMSYLPASSLIPLRRYLADVYLLVPIAGLALATSGLLAWIDGHGSRHFVRASQACLVVLVLMLAALSWRQLDIWADGTALWRHTLRYHPNSPQVCRMLGHAHNERGEHARALAAYRRCAQQFGLDLFAHNLALSHFMLGQHEEARRLWQWILERQPGDRRARKYMQLMQRAGRGR